MARAGYTFVFWGLYHGFWLAAERMYVTYVGPLPGGIVAWARTLLTVMIGWVFFRATSMEQAFHFVSTMSGMSQATVVYYNSASFLIPRNVFFILCGVFFALYPFESFSMRFDGPPWRMTTKGLCAVVIFVYAVALLQVNSFNPFIYFRF